MPTVITSFPGEAVENYRRRWGRLPSEEPNMEAYDEQQRSLWLPIESAPKDGRFLLLTDGRKVTRGWWLIVAQIWGYDLRGEITATKWQPMPLP